MRKTYFVVSGILKYKDRFLILKKSPQDKNYPEHWSFCSGFVKEFESGEDAVIREIKEETGLDAEIITKGKIIEVEDKTKEKNWVIMVFLCETGKTDIKLDYENSEYRWITKDDFRKFKFVPGIVDDAKSVGLL